MPELVWLAKRPLPLAALDGADSALEVALRAWSERRVDGLLPPRCALDTPQLRLLLPEAEWLAPPAPDGGPAPLGRFAALLERFPVDVAVGQDIQRALMKTAEAADPRAARRSLGELLREDQRTVRFTGSPLLQDLLVQGPLAVERWRQLLLPTADDGIRVKELWQLCHLRESRPVAGPPSTGAARRSPRPPAPDALDALPAAGPGGADGPASRRAWPGTPRP